MKAILKTSETTARISFFQALPHKAFLFRSMYFPEVVSGLQSNKGTRIKYTPFLITFLGSFA